MAKKTAKPDSKPRGNPRIKEAWAAYRAMKEAGITPEQIADLVRSVTPIEEVAKANALLDANPSATVTGVHGQPETIKVDSNSGFVIDPYEVYVEQDDPLRVLTNDWHSIILMSTNSSFVKCRAGESARLGMKWLKTYFSAQRVKRWRRYPEKFEDLEPEMRKERQEQTKDFWFHEIRPSDAEDAFPDEHPKGMPTHAHIRVEDYKASVMPGAMGVKKRKASDCKFRELLRRIFQECHNSCWPDTDHKFIRFLTFAQIIKGDSEELVFPENRPNPYGVTFETPQLIPRYARDVR